MPLDVELPRRNRVAGRNAFRDRHSGGPSDCWATAKPRIPPSPSPPITAWSAPSKRCSRPNKLRSKWPNVPCAAANGHGPDSPFRGRAFASSTARNADWAGFIRSRGARLIDSFYPPSYYGVTGAKFVPIVEALVRIVGARHVRMLSRGLARGAARAGRWLRPRRACFRRLPTAVSRFTDLRSARRPPPAPIRGPIIRIGAELEQAGYPADWFDEVIIWHVLEHLPRSAADDRRNRADPEAGRALDRRRSQLQQPAGAVVGCGLVPSRFAAPLVPLSARRTAAAAGRYRVYAAERASFLAAAKPLRMGAKRLEPVAPAAAKRALHAAEIAARRGARTTPLSAESRFAWRIGWECRSPAR